MSPLAASRQRCWDRFLISYRCARRASISGVVDRGFGTERGRFLLWPSPKARAARGGNGARQPAGARRLREWVLSISGDDVTYKFVALSLRPRLGGQHHYIIIYLHNVIEIPGASRRDSSSDELLLLPMGACTPQTQNIDGRRLAHAVVVLGAVPASSHWLTQEHFSHNSFGG